MEPISRDVFAKIQYVYPVTAYTTLADSGGASYFRFTDVDTNPFTLVSTAARQNLYNYSIEPSGLSRQIKAAILDIQTLYTMIELPSNLNIDDIYGILAVNLPDTSQTNIFPVLVSLTPQTVPLTTNIYQLRVTRPVEHTYTPTSNVQYIGAQNQFSFKFYYTIGTTTTPIQPISAVVFTGTLTECF